MYTPIINSGIVLLAFTVVHGIMIYQIQSPSAFTDEIGRRMFSNYLFISLVASLLTVLFIYFWQKHRVHIRYIEHIFTRDELQKGFLEKSRKNQKQVIHSKRNDNPSPVDYRPAVPYS
ncbi:MAG: hypothetical protein IPH20_21155 [Bacteroidales bacterium]|nr:hypothetical protein [Bacteroidales bacterium]